MMNKRLSLVLCCALLLSALAFSVTAQEGTCQVNYGQLQSALNNLLNGKSAVTGGDSASALVYLTEAQTLMETLVNACGGGLNWCYPGQPWGDGRCNGPDLSQDQVDWFWACGTYWAEYEHGLLDVVPGWCGFDSDGDGYPDDADQCPNQGGYVDDTGCPLDCNPNLDADCDGTPDSYDQCPADPNKIAPGVCGCGVSDADSDGDGMPYCNDQCPTDPNKTAPGACGCGVADTDSDGDGVANCNDACPVYDPVIVGGICTDLGVCYSIQSAYDWDGDGCLSVFDIGGRVPCPPAPPNCF